MVNVVSDAAALIGALIAYAIGESLEMYVPILLSITAGFFVYIALSDLIPEIHHAKNKKAALAQSILLLAGIMVVWIAISLLGEVH